MYFSIIEHKQTIMKKIQYQCPHLGAYIAELQYVVPVDGRLLSEAALARRAHMSKTTVENVKKR